MIARQWVAVICSHVEEQVKLINEESITSMDIKDSVFMFQVADRS